MINIQLERPSLLSDLSVESRTKLNVASDEAQDLKRSLVRGANVLIIREWYAGKTFIYDRLNQLVIRVSIMDARDSCWEGMARKGVIVDILPLNFTDNDSSFERVLEITGYRERSRGKFDAGCTLYEDSVSRGLWA